MVLSKGFAPGKGRLSRITDYSSVQTICAILFVFLLHSSVFHVLHLIFGGMAASALDSLILWSDLIS